MTLKILNLYAGIGGNRKLWDGDIEVTAVESNPDIAAVYKYYFPNDKIIIGDAHKFLLEHFNEFNFIWTSPPCPSHSDWRRLWTDAGKLTPIYPEMDLYQEILLLKHYFKGFWVVENVISYYEPLIKPSRIANHYIWSNFTVGDMGKVEKRGSREDRHYLAKRKGFMLPDWVKNKRQLLRNCCEPELGKHIFNMLPNRIKQKTLIEV